MECVFTQLLSFFFFQKDESVHIFCGQHRSAWCDNVPSSGKHPLARNRGSRHSQVTLCQHGKMRVYCKCSWVFHHFSGSASRGIESTAVNNFISSYAILATDLGLGSWWWVMNIPPKSSVMADFFSRGGDVEGSKSSVWVSMEVAGSVVPVACSLRNINNNNLWYMHHIIHSMGFTTKGYYKSHTQLQLDHHFHRKDHGRRCRGLGAHKGCHSFQGFQNWVDILSQSHFVFRQCHNVFNIFLHSFVCHCRIHCSLLFNISFYYIS